MNIPCNIDLHSIHVCHAWCRTVMFWFPAGIGWSATGLRRDDRKPLLFRRRWVSNKFLCCCPFCARRVISYFCVKCVHTYSPSTICTYICMSAAVPAPRYIPCPPPLVPPPLMLFPILPLYTPWPPRLALEPVNSGGI